MKDKTERMKFPYLNSAEELDSTPEADTGYFVSPGGTASSLRMDRAHIRTLEARGLSQVTGYTTLAIGCRDCILPSQVMREMITFTSA
ncbi:hypothetical protein D3C87_1515200 [compost metagenome]